MEKLKLAPLLLSTFLIRLMVTGASIGDAVALMSLASLYGFYLFLEYKKEPEINKDLKDRLAALEGKVQQTDNKVAGLTLSSQRRF